MSTIGQMAEKTPAVSRQGNGAEAEPLLCEHHEVQKHEPSPIEAGRSLIENCCARTQVLKHLIGLRGLTAMAQCSHFLAVQIWSDRSLWRVIDFGTVPTANAARLCDKGLYSLLDRVRARDATERISLRGCTSLTGRGLEPIRGSMMLRSIDLRLAREHETTVGATGLDDTAVLDVLSSMLPRFAATRTGIDPSSALSLVQFRRSRQSWHWQTNNVGANGSRFFGFAPEIEQWLARWHSTMVSVMQVELKPCDHCSEVIVKAPAEGTTGAFRCDTCSTFSCSMGECPRIGSCYQCQASFCDSCRCVRFCNLCELPFCDACRPVNFCEDCDLPFCDQCRSVRPCEICEFSSCHECSPTFFCEACGYTFCTGCRDAVFCENCCKEWCLACKELSECVECEQGYCQDCRIVSFCEVCRKNYCSACRAKSCCELCGLDYCTACRDLSFSKERSKEPSKNRFVSFCVTCRKEYCTDCDNLWFCDGCREEYCLDCRLVSFCEVCRESYCTECRDMSLCDTCGKEYCTGSCRGLSLCKACRNEASIGTATRSRTDSTSDSTAPTADASGTGKDVLDRP